MTPTISPLSLLVQRTIPLVFDDTLSYVELLGVVVAKVNEIVTSNNAYFNFPLTQYVTELLAQWQADGTLQVVISEGLQTDMDTLEGLMTDLTADYEAWKLTIDAEVQSIASVANAKRIDVLTANPTGADLYDGRIWLIKYLEQLVIDNLDAANDTTGAAGYADSVAYKTSLNFKPTESMGLKRLQIKLKSGPDTLHNNAQNIRVRVCADDGSGKPDETVVLANGAIYGCPVGNEIPFVGECIFGTPVSLIAGTRYHFVLDINSTTEKSFYRSFLLVAGSSTNELSMNTYSGGVWSTIYEAYDVGIKIWKI